MASLYGYREGPRLIKTYLMDSSGSADIAVGDHVKFDTAGYVVACGSGDNPIGVAASIGKDPSADGDTTVQVDIGEWSIYEYPVSAGTVSVSLISKTCDLGGAQSIDITASADDNIIIVAVDTAKSTVFVRHSYPHSGVV